MPVKKLNQAQAQAIYSAMVELNNVSGRIKAMIPTEPKTPGSQINVFETEDGVIAVRVMKHFAIVYGETYNSQSDFALAYNVS